MSKTDVSNSMDEVIKDGPTHMLFNDLHFSHLEAVSPIPSFSAWLLFPRLPVELRLHIWTVHLQRHRMIEIDICPADEDPHGYTDRNHLRRIVSGRRYTFNIRGRGPSFVPPLSLLLQVNREARGAVLSFYHIRLPLPGRQHKEQVLYLNPDYDVVYVRPRKPKPGTYRQFATLLVDFLHDARAYDYKDQGVAHLALDRAYPYYLFDGPTPEVYLTPGTLHPDAAASFADILRHKLRSLFFVIGFRCPTRGMGVFPSRNWRFHFAQTFPLRRRGHPASAFHWFEADPRPGLDLDLLQLPLSNDPRELSQGWRRLESAFGITQEERAAREKHHDGFRFYICPTQKWPTQAMRRANGTITFHEGDEEEEEEVWSRDEMAQHLQFEAEDWLSERERLTSMLGGTDTFPKYAYTSPEATERFELMEKLPCTAVGMWTFPPDAFKEFINPSLFCFNVSGVRPGLFLFQV
ncbi:hypothetical protein B0I37DRAFT_387563 [Chaetomium sp. MPI-CAGE-AT-0009]|nr:hypothetical protein B0I37DRAFT_387563 [Chaetomium sp. MPI-CAGE-AT-0009]